MLIYANRPEMLVLFLFFKVRMCLLPLILFKLDANRAYAAASV